MTELLGVYDAAIMRHTVIDIVRRSAARTPGALAVSYQGTSYSYRQLLDAALAAAGGLAAAGVGAGDRVAVYARNSDLYVISWLATQALGAVHVPINFMLGAGEVGYILGHCEPVYVLADGDLYDVLHTAAEQAGVSATLAVQHPRSGNRRSDLVLTAPAGGAAQPAGPSNADTVAQIAYTSGTEARPKGAQLTHRALIAQYLSCIVDGEYRRDDRVLNALPLYHCAQMHCFLMPSLYLGAANYIIDAPTPDNMIAAVEEHEITSMFCPPTVWIGILRSAGFDASRLETVRKGYYGASIMPVETVKELSSVLPDMRLWNFYGQTEIAPLATVLPPHEQLSKPGSAGRATLHVETRVVDDFMNDVAVGDVGEVVHRSPQVMSGYYNDEDKTAEAFVNGWFHSGDLATMDEDGYLTIVDRKKDMIKTGGENVASREVEEVLYEHPGVAEVAVIGLPDAKWIERVCAVVVPRAGADPVGLAEELTAFGHDRLATFKRPKQVELIDALPKNPSGKILKRELRDRFSS
ncbi:MAG: fatty acyl-CoA synthetase [Actinomycetota bacterium]|nr:fatty acyl-CoA synthetase [Actinomycetota bacterium]